MYPSQEALKSNTCTRYLGMMLLMSANNRRVLDVVMGASATLFCTILATAKRCAAHEFFFFFFSHHVKELRWEIAKLEKSKNDVSIRRSLRVSSERLFPPFVCTGLKDMNDIRGADEDMSTELLSTWNFHQEVVKRALEQRQFTTSGARCWLIIRKSG